jgi:NADH-quinone oxidoreductase subunit E
VQNELGYLSADGMAEVASILDLAPSEVQAVSTFYSMYFDHPEGDHHVIVCINVSCGLRGADEIVEHVEKRLGCPSGGTTADRRFTWESTVECLGACGGAPAMQVDHHFHENLTPERVDAILERLGSQPRPGHGDGTIAAPGAPAAERIEAPDAEDRPTPKPRTARSAPRKRPRPDASDL